MSLRGATMLASAAALGARAAREEIEVNAAPARYLADPHLCRSTVPGRSLVRPAAGLVEGMERTAAWLRADGGGVCHGCRP